MNEFIKKLIERLEEEKNTIYNTIMISESNVDLGRTFGLEKTIEIVNQLTEEYNNGWIPCEIELPPQPKKNPLFEGKALEIYLVSVEGENYPFRAFWNGEFFTQGFRRENVVAWQQLPGPYQPEGESL